MAIREHTLNQRFPKWVIAWLVLGNLLAFTDNFVFLLLRPRTLPGGDLSFLWPHMQAYVEIDHSFGDINNPFIWAQSLITVVEIGFGVTALMANLKSRFKLSYLFGFGYGLLSSFHVGLIFLVEIISGFAYLGHNPTSVIAGAYFLPNSFWIVVPLLISVHCGRKLLR